MSVRSCPPLLLSVANEWLAGSAAQAVVDWAERLHMDQLPRAATEARTEVLKGREEAQRLRKEVKEAKHAA